MTTYAGPPVFPPYFVDPLGKPQRSVKITVYERGTDTKPDLYADREKSTPLGNPFWASSLGNAEFRVDATGEFEAEVNGVRIAFTVVADPEEPVTIGAGAVEEAMLAFGVATQDELDTAIATREPSIPPGTYPEIRSTPPDPSVVAYIDSSTVPPTLQVWDGSAWVAASGSGGTGVTTGVLTETGDFLITESGDYLVLEAA